MMSAPFDRQDRGMSLSARTAPRLATERLILRPFRLDDFDGFAALHASPHARWMWALDRDAAWTRMLSLAGEWAVRGLGMWAIEDAASGAFLGHAGFLMPHDAAEAELGWAVAASAEGRGLAYEAVVAARDFGASQLGLRRPISQIDARNDRSIRLAARLNAVEEDRITFAPDAVCLVFRHPDVTGAP